MVQATNRIYFGWKAKFSKGSLARHLDCELAEHTEWLGNGKQHRDVFGSGACRQLLTPDCIMKKLRKSNDNSQHQSPCSLNEGIEG